MNSLHYNQGNYYYSFDVSGWNRASDAEFLDGLTYSDKLNRFFFDYSEVIDNIATRIAISLLAYYAGEIEIRTMRGVDATRWQIMDNGDLVHPHTGKWRGNLFDYIDER